MGTVAFPVVAVSHVCCGSQTSSGIHLLAGPRIASRDPVRPSGSSTASLTVKHPPHSFPGCGSCPSGWRILSNSFSLSFLFSLSLIEYGNKQTKKIVCYWPGWAFHCPTSHLESSEWWSWLLSKSYPSSCQFNFVGLCFPLVKIVRRSGLPCLLINIPQQGRRLLFTTLVMAARWPALACMLFSGLWGPFRGSLGPHLMHVAMELLWAWVPSTDGILVSYMVA